jgi:hypothetical protein
VIEARNDFLRIGWHLGYRYVESPCWRIITQGERYIGRFPVDKLPEELDFGNRDRLEVLIVAIDKWELMGLRPMGLPKGIRIKRSRRAIEPILWQQIMTPHWKMEQLVWVALGEPITDYYAANRKSHSLASAYIANRAVSDPAEFRAAWLSAADAVQRTAERMVRMWNWHEAGKVWLP